MTIDSIKFDLLCGKTIFGDAKVQIRQDGERYVAEIHAEKYNTLVMSPLTINPEGIISFCERVATKLIWILKR